MWCDNSGGRDVVFFMHGILDTSMGWVSNGVTGSQAFAAFDQGFDVWLGNSRANPPREHTGKHTRPVCCRAFSKQIAMLSSFTIQPACQPELTYEVTLLAV